MPIYEYQCSSCHHTFDLIQKMSDEPVKICPECSKETAVRLVSAAGFQLKGTGWYATDFKNQGQPGKNMGTGKKTESAVSSNVGSSEKKSPEPAASSKPTKDE